MRSAGGTGSGEDERVSARGGPAGYARTIRGGRSGPSAAKASTVGAKAQNTVGAKSGAGTANIVVKMAPIEQHEAQALHFCFTAETIFAGSAGGAGFAPSPSSRATASP